MQQKKIICLGDSLTEGYPFFGKKSWVSILNEKNTAQFINKGLCGQTSKQIADRFCRDVLDEQPDFVFLLLGTNDFLFTNATAEDVLEQVSIIALTAKDKGILPVLLTPALTIPEMASQAWNSDIDYVRVNKHLETFKKLLLGLSSAAQIPCIDLQTAYARLTAMTSIAEYYSDGLHPTALGYQKIAEIIENFCETSFHFDIGGV